MTCDSSIAIPIIAAASALAGVVVSQASAAILAWRERAYQRRILLREKYEEMGHLLSDSFQPIQDLLSATTTDYILKNAQNIPARRMYTLTLLYFPLLKQEASSYLDSFVSFQNELAINFKPNSSDTVGVQGAFSPKVNEANQKLLQSKMALESAIEKHANTYAAA